MRTESTRGEGAGRLNADGGADTDLADVLSGAPDKRISTDEPKKKAGKKPPLV